MEWVSVPDATIRMTVRWNPSVRDAGSTNISSRRWEREKSIYCHDDDTGGSRHRIFCSAVWRRQGNEHVQDMWQRRMQMKQFDRLEAIFIAGIVVALCIVIIGSR